jgi:hypothetical protein
VHKPHLQKGTEPLEDSKKTAYQVIRFARVEAAMDHQKRHSHAQLGTLRHGWAVCKSWAMRAENRS